MTSVVQAHVLYESENDTINVDIFAGAKFRENVGKAFQVGVIFTIIFLISLIK